MYYSFGGCCTKAILGYTKAILGCTKAILGGESVESDRTRGHGERLVCRSRTIRICREEAWGRENKRTGEERRRREAGRHDIP